MKNYDKQQQREEEKTQTIMSENTDRDYFSQMQTSLRKWCLVYRTERF
jgi:hypothetical protein